MSVSNSAIGSRASQSLALPPSTLLDLSQFLDQQDLAQFSSTCRLLHPLLYKRPRISTARQAALFLEALLERTELGEIVLSLSLWATRDVPDEDDKPCIHPEIHEDQETAEWEYLPGVVIILCSPASHLFASFFRGGLGLRRCCGNFEVLSQPIAVQFPKAERGARLQ